MSKTISILGSTGSIGRQTLDVAEQLGLRVAALTANSRVGRIEEQARRRGLNGIMLATARGFPAENFYLKNGFRRLDDTALLVK